METTTSKAAVAVPARSPTVKVTREPRARARPIISAEESRPSTCAPGHRIASPAVNGPGPQPRSITRAGSSAPTRAIRSAKGRDRSSEKRSYWSGSHETVI